MRTKDHLDGYLAPEVVTAAVSRHGDEQSDVGAVRRSHLESCYGFA